MTLSQEESLYLNPQAREEKMYTDLTDTTEASAPSDATALLDEANAKPGAESRPDQYEASSMMEFDVESEDQRPKVVEKAAVDDAAGSMDEGGAGTPSPPSELRGGEQRSKGSSGRGSGSAGHAGGPLIDQELDWSSDLKEWECSRKRLRPQYPSATFQPYSKFKGTQQSDKQVYNVEVTLLTVDLEQSTMSGYLQICGLTPDHPTLTTFFTGEIIGGPHQKYSFRTRDASWGASDKTDLTHWARFPAWRPLSLQAKRDINFVYPRSHENWWQQETIFMRWKEHFLVPDYKLKSIQGASFEGFYYICFDQLEGRVSGIYFHSKSEK
jgi:hypothetical protein